jgi:hypothetical protein
MGRGGPLPIAYPADRRKLIFTPPLWVSPPRASFGMAKELIVVFGSTGNRIKLRNAIANVKASKVDLWSVSLPKRGNSQFAA